MKHLELFGKLLWKQFMFMMIGLTCVSMLGSACLDAETPAQPNVCLHHNASECTRFCTQNGMEVASWDGNHPSSHCPRCGCSCKPRNTNP